MPFTPTASILTMKSALQSAEVKVSLIPRFPPQAMLCDSVSRSPLRYFLAFATSGRNRVTGRWAILNDKIRLGVM